MSPPTHTWTRLWSPGAVFAGRHPSKRLRKPYEAVLHRGHRKGVGSVPWLPDPCSAASRQSAQMPVEDRDWSREVGH